MGRFAAERWRLAGEDATAPEVLIGGEGLARGAGPVLATLLHEAAHALASVRGVPETSRRGQYHNKRFKALAEELGLHVDYDPRIGWSPTTLPAATAAVYAAQITAIAAAITAVRRHEPSARGHGRPRTTPMATCRCPRRIRVAPSVLAAGAIVCALCDQPFKLAEQPAASAAAAVTAPPGSLRDASPEASDAASAAAAGDTFHPAVTAGDQLATRALRRARRTGLAGLAAARASGLARPRSRTRRRTCRT